MLEPWQKRLALFSLLVFGGPNFIKGSPLSIQESKDTQDSVIEIYHQTKNSELEEIGLENERPIIAILSQELGSSLLGAYENMNFSSYIGAAYVKAVESAGARVVPVLINQDDEYYEKIFNSTNGLLIPGGAVSLTTSGYAKAGKKFFDMARKSWDENKDPYPIWGTCLGFELLALLAVDGQRNLASCSSQDQALPLNFTEAWVDSYIGKAMPEDVQEIVASQNVTINFHKWCLTPTNFSVFHMENFWSLLATGNDLNNLEFVALIEANDYPIWGSQFHPEKNAYEWTTKYENIPHNFEAVKAGSFFADFFVQQARKSFHKFSSQAEEEEFLIYNYNPYYTGHSNVGYVMEQCYMFT